MSLIVSPTQIDELVFRLSKIIAIEKEKSLFSYEVLQLEPLA